MIPTTRDYLQAELDRYLPDARTSHGEARERARYEVLHRIIPSLRAELRRADAAFRAAVARSKNRMEGN